jgi:RNA polymerase sigma-70 factor, ECF subfamily
MNPGSDPTTTSAQLLERAKAGDRAALDALIRLYLPRLRRWARGRLPAGARGVLETEDIVQETAMKAVQQLDRLDLRAEGALQAYLRQALKNRFIDLYRGEERRPVQEELPSDVPAAAPSPLETAIGSAALERYEEALASLSEDDHQAIVLRVEMCWGYDEIATAMHKGGASQARVMVSRALDRLARKMRHERR